MKVPVRIIGRKYRTAQVGDVINVSRGASRVLVAGKRAELVEDATPQEAKQVAKLTQAVAKTVANREAAVKKAPAKKAAAKKAPAKKTTTRTVRGTRNASMAGKTGTKAE